MIWAEIKKALNSTLGAPNFKSLDNIITDSKNEINGAISGVNSAISGISGGTNGINNTVNEVKNNIAGITGTINDIQRRATDIQNKTQETINRSASAEQIAAINRNHLENSTYGLNAILNATRSMGGVKSIQRGTVSKEFDWRYQYDSTSEDNLVCNIAPVNTNKSIIIYFAFCESVGSGENEEENKRHPGINNAIHLIDFTSPTSFKLIGDIVGFFFYGTKTSSSGSEHKRRYITIAGKYLVIEFY